MPLPNYRELEELDARGIRRLLDPNYDRSESRRIAAERALGGGGFSGARQNRLQESELMQRQLAGHQMLTPYLQMEQQRVLQTQGEAAALARQVAQNNAEIERLTLQQNHATAGQLREIEAQKRALETQNAAAMERLQLSEQGATSRQAMQEQGTNARHASGIAADLQKHGNSISSAFQIARGGWANDRDIAALRFGATGGGGGNGGGNQSGQYRPTSGGGQSGPNSATMNAVHRAINGGFKGGSENPLTLAREGQIGNLMSGGNALGNGLPAPSYGQMSGGYVGGNFRSEGGGGKTVDTTNYYGNQNSEPQPIWQSGSNPEELVWGGVDDQINNNRNWVDNSAYQFDPSLYA